MWLPGSVNNQFPSTSISDQYSFSANPFSIPRAGRKSYLRNRLVAVGTLFLFLTSAFARSHEHYGEGLDVNLDAPYEKALTAVQQVVQNGVVQGTWQYRGQSELEGATYSQSAPGFFKDDQEKQAGSRGQALGFL